MNDEQSGTRDKALNTTVVPQIGSDLRRSGRNSNLGRTCTSRSKVGSDLVRSEQDLKLGRTLTRREETVANDTDAGVGLECIRKRSLNNIETGEIKRYKINVILHFESYPVWLFSLHRNMVSIVFVPRLRTWTDLALHLDRLGGNPELVHTWISHLGRSQFRLGSTETDPATLHLISGSVPFFMRLTEGAPRGFKSIFLHDSHFRG